MLGRNMSGLLERHLEISQIYPPKDGMFVDYSADPIIDTSAQTAVLCADGENVTETDNAYWRDYVAKQVSISSVAGEFWARLRMSCAGWKSRPNWVFRGPFTTPKATGPGEALQPGRPAAPLLFASNRYDPVTPLRNARRMAESHPGAGVLVQEAAGHCLVLGAMGPCAKEALAEYFDTGVVPGEEKICQAALGPWDPEPEVGEMGDLEHIWRGRLRQFTV
jgi:pimeloyl-ACP methyl ester carboxylesterase